MAIDLVDYVADLLLGQEAVDQLKGNRRMTRQDLGQQHAPRGGLDQPYHWLARVIVGAKAGFDASMQRHRLRLERKLDLTDTGEQHALALFVRALHRDVIETEDDVLRRYDDWLAVRRAQDVVGRQH